MKKTLSLVLALLFVLSATLTLTVTAADETPADVPKVFITTKTGITTDYCDCSIKIIDKKGGEYETITDDASSVKVRGNSTSSGAKKPYNIKFSSKTGVLGMGKNKKWCLLANCYEKTLMRNQTVLDFAASIGLKYTPKYRVVDVYVNGKFGGSYLLTDAVAASSSRVDIDTDENEFLLERDARTDEGTVYFESPLYGLRFGINEPEEPTDAQYKWLMNFLTEAEKALKSGDFAKIEKYFDIPSMVDFYIVLEYFKNVDINVGSTRFYIKGDKIYGGPCWDFDLSSGNCSSAYYTDYNNVYGSGKSYEGTWAETLWFKPLLGYKNFSDAVKSRYLDLQDEIINLYCDNVLGKNYIDRTLDEYGASFARNYKEAGWSITYQYSNVCGTLERRPENTYEGNVAYYRGWLKNRNLWLLSHWNLTSEITAKTGSDYKIKDYTVINGREKTKISDFLINFMPYGAISRDGKTVSATDFVYNTDIMSVGGASYKVIVLGDVLPNGKIESRDYALIKRGVLKTYELNSDELLASDINGNGKLDTLDYVMVKRHVLGTYDIYK